MEKYVIVFAFLWISGMALAQNNASYKEFDKTYLTYPFSDPDPIPSAKKIYHDPINQCQGRPTYLLKVMCLILSKAYLQLSDLLF